MQIQLKYIRIITCAAMHETATNVSVHRESLKSIDSLSRNCFPQLQVVFGLEHWSTDHAGVLSLKCCTAFFASLHLPS